MALGKQIITLSDLHDTALRRKAVTCPASITFKRHTSAAFVISMQGTTIHRLLSTGLYEYIPKDQEVD